jgi:hypothetical protein
MGDALRSDATLSSDSGARHAVLVIFVDRQNISFSKPRIGIQSTNKAATLSHHILHVDSLRSCKKVGRITTRPIVARMTDQLPLGDFPFEVREAYTMYHLAVDYPVSGNLQPLVSLLGGIRIGANPASVIQFYNAT